MTQTLLIFVDSLDQYTLTFDKSCPSDGWHDRCWRILIIKYCSGLKLNMDRFFYITFAFLGWVAHAGVAAEVRSSQENHEKLRVKKQLTSGARPSRREGVSDWGKWGVWGKPGLAFLA